MLTNPPRHGRQRRAVYFVCLYRVRMVIANHKHPTERDLNHLVTSMMQDFVIY